MKERETKEHGKRRAKESEEGDMTGGLQRKNEWNRLE